MTTNAPGSPPEGSIWIVCDLRVVTEPRVAAFEQRVLATRDAFWTAFWTTPPLYPSHALFEVTTDEYHAHRTAIDAWIAAQPELAAPRVVEHLHSAEQRAT